MASSSGASRATAPVAAPTYRAGIGAVSSEPAKNGGFLVYFGQMLVRGERTSPFVVSVGAEVRLSAVAASKGDFGASMARRARVVSIAYLVDRSVRSEETKNGIIEFVTPENATIGLRLFHSASELGLSENENEYLIGAPVLASPERIEAVLARRLVYSDSPGGATTPFVSRCIHLGEHCESRNLEPYDGSMAALCPFMPSRGTAAPQPPPSVRAHAPVPASAAVPPKMSMTQALYPGWASKMSKLDPSRSYAVSMGSGGYEFNPIDLGRGISGSIHDLRGEHDDIDGGGGVGGDDDAGVWRLAELPPKGRIRASTSASRNAERPMPAPKRARVDVAQRDGDDDGVGGDAGSEDDDLFDLAPPRQKIIVPAAPKLRATPVLPKKRRTAPTLSGGPTVVTRSSARIATLRRSSRAKPENRALGAFKKEVEKRGAVAPKGRASKKTVERDVGDDDDDDDNDAGDSAGDDDHRESDSENESGSESESDDGKDSGADDAAIDASDDDDAASDAGEARLDVTEDDPIVFSDKDYMDEDGDSEADRDDALDWRNNATSTSINLALDKRDALQRDLEEFDALLAVVDAGRPMQSCARGKHIYEELVLPIVKTAGNETEEQIKRRSDLVDAIARGSVVEKLMPGNFFAACGVCSCSGKRTCSSYLVANADAAQGLAKDSALPQQVAIGNHCAVKVRALLGVYAFLREHSSERTGDSLSTPAERARILDLYDRFEAVLDRLRDSANATRRSRAGS